MNRSFAAALVAVTILGQSLPAQGDIQRGTIKKVDADKGVLTVTAEGKDHEFLVTEQTRIWDAGMQELPDRLRDKGIRAGAAVQFKPGEKDGKTILLGLKLTGNGKPEKPREPRRAKIKSADAEKMTVTLTVDGKDQTFEVIEKTRIANVPGDSLKEQLRSKELKEGTEADFLAGLRDGKAILFGLRLPDRSRERPKLPKADTSKLKPLTELGKELYQEFSGGLYPSGSNDRPAAHEAAGLVLAKKVQPLDEKGKPSVEGKIVLLSVGMSNTTQEFSLFKQQADADKEKNPKLVLVDGAQGGMTAARIRNPDDNGSGERFWSTVDQRLRAAGAAREQVQIAWIKQADAGPTQGFPRYAKTLQAELATIVQMMHSRFPNLKLVYLSSRTYGGYARTGLNPEPYAYESGFSVKWLIEQQLKGDAELNFDPAKGKTRAPWLSWGPYLWANSTMKRADGFMYEESDFAGDGTHPSQSGRRKVAELLLKFFKTDATARSWFVRP